MVGNIKIPAAEVWRGFDCYADSYMLIGWPCIATVIIAHVYISVPHHQAHIHTNDLVQLHASDFEMPAT